MNSNKQVKVKSPHRVLTPGAVTLISVGDYDDDNLFPVAWTMAIRKEPPMVALESGKGHYSYKLMMETGDFGLNIPDSSIAEEVIKSGKVSGKEVEDKFKESGLNRETAKEIDAPLVKEAVAKLECRITNVHDMGNSALITAQIINGRADKEHYKDEKWDFSNGLELLHHMGGSEFAVCDHSLEV